MKVLYHASPDTNLSIIEPKRTISKDIYIGDYVFATYDKKLAAMYLATKGNATLMNVKTGKPIIVICSNPRDYLKSDKGGAIYTVPAITFKRTPQKGLEQSELISGVSVKPLYKKIYKRSIDAMKEMGVTIYFVDQESFDKLIEPKDGRKILSVLQPFSKN